MNVGLGTGRLRPNTVLQNRYIIVKKVGQGGMAAVYQATDQRIAGRLWAIKEMSMSLLNTPAARTQAVQTFRQEAGMLAGLDHPNLPKVADFFDEGGRYYLVMDFVEGETLKEKLDAQGRQPLLEAEVLEWAEQLCDALEYLHSQNPPVIFRDLKPSNIMVTPDERVKLIDFGIARHFKPGQAQDTRRFGTKGYAPPEQHGKGQTDARSDIYSLGVTLHELLTGHDPTAMPFNRPLARQLNPSVSAHVDAVIRQATQHNRGDRFQSVAAMRQALIPPALSVSPRALDFGTLQVGQSTSQSLQITNTGGGLLNGTVRSAQAWLRSNPASFSGNSTTVRAQVDTSGLKSGQQYQAALDVSSNAGTDRIPVSMATAGAGLPVLPALIGGGIVLILLCALMGVAATRYVLPLMSTPTPTALPATVTPTSTYSPGGPTATTETPTLSPTMVLTSLPTVTNSPTHTSTRTRTPTASSTPAPRPITDPNFRADSTTIRKGECTTLRWDVDDIREVYLDGHGQPGHGSTQVCPNARQTFTLTVVERDGRRIEHHLTIRVSGEVPVPVFEIQYHGCIGGLSKGIGQVKGQVFDRHGRIIAGAVVEVTVDGVAGVVPPGRTNEAGWYEWNLTPGQRIRFVSLKVGGRPVSFTPSDFEVVSQSGCYQHVNFKQR